MPNATYETHLLASKGHDLSLSTMLSWYDPDAVGFGKRAGLKEGKII